MPCQDASIQSLHILNLHFFPRCDLLIYCGTKTCNNSDNHKTCQTLENVICSKGTRRKCGRGASSKSLHLFGLHLVQVFPRGPELPRTADHRACCQNLSQYRLWKDLEIGRYSEQIFEVQHSAVRWVRLVWDGEYGGYSYVGTRGMVRPR